MLAVLPWLLLLATPVGRRVVFRAARPLLALLPVGKLPLAAPVDQLPVSGVPTNVTKPLPEGALQPFYLSLVLATLLAGPLVAGRRTRLALPWQLPL